MKSYNIAIVGATGLVGGMFLKVMEEFDIKVNVLRVFASRKSIGKKIVFQEKDYFCEVIEDGSFQGIDFALFSAGGDVSKQYAPQAVKEGAIVIDNSSHFRMDQDVPLVVPEINLNDALNQSLIANPNCSTIQAVLPLFVLKQNYGVTHVEYNTYQAASGAGKKGIDDLILTRTGNHNQFFPHNLTKTCIPQIDAFLENGYTKEEAKMIYETRKILHHNQLAVSATCVRVPVQNSHGVSIRARLTQDVTIHELKEVLHNTPGIKVVDDPSRGVYPTGEMSNETDIIYVGRIRKDLFDPYTVLLYTVADNIRKGAASNAVQIMMGLM